MALADKMWQSDANNLPRLAAVCECANGRRRHKMVLTSSRGASGCSECDASRPFYHHRGQCSFIQITPNCVTLLPSKNHFISVRYQLFFFPEFCLNKISGGAILCRGRAISLLHLNLEGEIYIPLLMCSGAFPRQDLDTRLERLEEVKAFMGRTISLLELFATDTKSLNEIVVDDTFIYVNMSQSIYFKT